MKWTRPELGSHGDAYSLYQYQTNIIWCELNTVYIPFGENACTIYKVFAGVLEWRGWCQLDTITWSKLPKDMSTLLTFCLWQPTSLEHKLIENLWEWIPETHTINAFPRWFLHTLKLEHPTLDPGSWWMETVPWSFLWPHPHPRAGPVSNSCTLNVCLSIHPFVSDAKVLVCLQSISLAWDTNTCSTHWDIYLN